MTATRDRQELDPLLNPALPPMPGKMRIALLLAFWTGIAIVTTTTVFIALRGGTPALWLNTFKPMILYYYSWAVMSVVIFAVVSRPMPQLKDKLQATLLCTLCLAFMVLFLPIVVHGDEWRDWLYGSRAPGSQILSVAIFLFLLVGSLALKYYRQGIARERDRLLEVERASRLAGELTQARLDALIMQINPHFLFNALNSIGALIETERKEDAYRTTELLGALLRQTLERSELKTTSLKEEVSFIETYIELEATRFGDRLLFERTIEPTAMTRQVPVFLLQPLVENAIKHAVSKTNRQVRISLSVQCDGADLVLRVADNGPGLPSGGCPQEGVGLKNTRARLALLYGREDLLSLAGTPGGGTTVTVRIPG